MAALLLAAEVWAARPATVKGPERAFLRRGPGTEFQAYATVENGEQVQVEEVTGTWALVKTANGQSGYVHAAFVFYADDQPVLVPTAAAVPPTVAAAVVAPTPGSQPTAARQPVVVAADDPVEVAARNAELKGEVETLRRELDALRRHPSAVVSPGDDLVSLRAEVRRLADTTDALRSRLDAPVAGVPLPLSDEYWATSTVVVLAGCALILGWVVGGALSRREERGRRNRIRF